MKNEGGQRKSSEVNISEESKNKNIKNMARQTIIQESLWFPIIGWIYFFYCFSFFPRYTCDKKHNVSNFAATILIEINYFHGDFEDETLW